MLSMLLAGAARAQNLVVNGDFATDVSGWSTAYHAPAISIAWSPLDPADPTPSGSVEVDTTGAAGGSGGPTQCVDLPATPVVLRMDVRVPSPQGSADPYADPYVRWYSGPGCSMSEISSTFPIGSVLAGVGWQRLEGPLAPPPSAQSVLIDLGLVRASGSSSPSVGYFDNVYLPEPGTIPRTAAVLTALAALACLRSRRTTARSCGLR